MSCGLCLVLESEAWTRRRPGADGHSGHRSVNWPQRELDIIAVTCENAGQQESRDMFLLADPSRLDAAFFTRFRVGT